MSREKLRWNERVVRSLVRDSEDETAEIGSPAYLGTGERSFVMTPLRSVAIWIFNRTHESVSP